MHPPETIGQGVFKANTIDNLAPTESSLAHLGRSPLEESYALKNLWQHTEVQTTVAKDVTETTTAISLPVVVLRIWLVSGSETTAVMRVEASSGDSSSKVVTAAN